MYYWTIMIRIKARAWVVSRDCARGELWLIMTSIVFMWIINSSAGQIFVIPYYNVHLTLSEDGCVWITGVMGHHQWLFKLLLYNFQHLNDLWFIFESLPTNLLLDASYLRVWAALAVYDLWLVLGWPGCVCGLEMSPYIDYHLNPLVQSANTHGSQHQTNCSSFSHDLSKILPTGRKD